MDRLALQKETSKLINNFFVDFHQETKPYLKISMGIF